MCVHAVVKDKQRTTVDLERNLHTQCINAKLHQTFCYVILGDTPIFVLIKIPADIPNGETGDIKY